MTKERRFPEENLSHAGIGFIPGGSSQNTTEPRADSGTPEYRKISCYEY